MKLRRLFLAAVICCISLTASAQNEGKSKGIVFEKTEYDFGTLKGTEKEEFITLTIPFINKEDFPVLITDVACSAAWIYTHQEKKLSFQMKKVK